MSKIHKKKSPKFNFPKFAKKNPKFVKNCKIFQKFPKFVNNVLSLPDWALEWLVSVSEDFCGKPSLLDNIERKATPKINLAKQIPRNQ